MSGGGSSPARGQRGSGRPPPSRCLTQAAYRTDHEPPLPDDDPKTSVTARTSSGHRPISFIDIDHAPTSEINGVSLAIRHVPIATEKRQYVLLDCPTETDRQKLMADTGIRPDAVILVVDESSELEVGATDHVKWARTAGVPHIIVFLNKTDIADPELSELAAMSVLDLLMAHDYPEDTPLIRGSASKALSSADPTDDVAAITALTRAMDTHIP
ncbi:GTP-binding protein [Streptomyces vinaceus]|uniref:GTP-binding protein n=1 Tax=Streptomyces vinaceus TaxID=1960 RepID=UPI003803D896